MISDVSWKQTYFSFSTAPCTKFYLGFISKLLLQLVLVIFDIYGFLDELMLTVE